MALIYLALQEAYKQLNYTYMVAYIVLEFNIKVYNINTKKNNFMSSF